MTRRIPGRKIGTRGNQANDRQDAHPWSFQSIRGTWHWGGGRRHVDALATRCPSRARAVCRQAAWPTRHHSSHGSDAPVVYALGGARQASLSPNTRARRAGLVPSSRRDLIDYPAGAPFSWMPRDCCHRGRATTSPSEAATDATNGLNQAIWNGIGTDVAVVGLSGHPGLDRSRSRTAGDPKPRHATSSPSPRSAIRPAQTDSARLPGRHLRARRYIR